MKTYAIGRKLETKNLEFQRFEQPTLIPNFFFNSQVNKYLPDIEAFLAQNPGSVKTIELNQEGTIYLHSISLEQNICFIITDDADMELSKLQQLAKNLIIDEILIDKINVNNVDSLLVNAKIQQANQMLDVTKKKMGENISKTLERGERLSALLEETEHLSAETVRFKTLSEKVNGRGCWSTLASYCNIM